METKHTEEEVLELYGKDAEEWLKRWDQGGNVWSIEMGGLGPGYEQALQIVAVEVVRWLLQNKPDLTEQWRATDNRLWEAIGPKIDYLGITGAQWGVAVWLAMQLYQKGPCEIMLDENLSERKIQIMKDFPSAPKVEEPIGPFNIVDAAGGIRTYE